MLRTVVTKIKLGNYINIRRLVYLHNNINFINIKLKYLLLSLEYMSPARHEKVCPTHLKCNYTNNTRPGALTVV